MPLPIFRYHPDPIATGSIKASPETCDCCRQARGFVYCSSIYSREKNKLTLCPWCIANGKAALKYDGSFSDDHPLRKAGIAEEIIQEVCERTPSYNSWQQEAWQSHCKDACEFHGDAEKAELRSLNTEAMAEILEYNMMKIEHWRHLLDHYEKGGNPAVYKFVCRQCHKSMYSLDFT